MKNCLEEIVFGNTILSYFQNVKDPRAGCVEKFMIYKENFKQGLI